MKAITEQTGDITLTCTGGVRPAVGSAIPQVNITVFYNTQVTSRLLPTSATSPISEALLLIDEPGSGLPPGSGLWPAAPQIALRDPDDGLRGIRELHDWWWIPAFRSPSTAVRAGITAGAQRVPGRCDQQLRDVLRYSGVGPRHDGSRVFRITNVRVNANPLAGGSASGASPVQASISISGATSLLITNATPSSAL